MKKAIIIVAVLAANLCASAQDSGYLNLWNKYVDECSVIVQDTITEHGTVTYDISPVDGDLKLIPIDTIWNIVKYKEYKSYYDNYFTLSDYAFTNLTYTTDTITGWYSTSEPTKNTFTTQIERTKICNMKLKQPNRDDFWEWLKGKGYRK